MMGELTDKRILLLLLYFAGLVYCQGQTVDPCMNYVVLNDTTLDITHTTLTTTGTFINGTGTWYRYTDTGESILASSCPNATQCGTTGQAWMNGTAPVYTDGPTLVDFCISNATDCCAIPGQVRVRNCITFVVYLLVPLQVGQRWCFDKALRVLPPAPITVATTKSGQGQGQGQSSPEGDTGLSPGVIAGICIPAVLGLLLILILAAVLRQKLSAQANTVDPSKPESSIDQNGPSPEKP